MADFFATTLGIMLSVGAVFAIVVVGALYLVGIWKGKKDNEDDRLIDILKGTVDALEQRVTTQKKEHDDILVELRTEITNLAGKVQDLENENEVLVKVLQGRDEKTQEFYKKAFDAIEVGAKTHALVEQMNKNHTELMKMLVEHLKPGVTVNQSNVRRYEKQSNT